MINLIPPSAKSSITREYWMRVVSTWLFILSGVAIIITALLIPVYVLVNSQVTAYQETAEEAISEVNKYDLSSTALVRASQDAAKILKMQHEPRFTDFITLFESLQSESVTLDHFEFMKQGGELTPISISGKAETRQALADFREALLDNDRIETVVLPISNLAQDKDITFTISVTMKKE
jgi:hypothetical protein